MSSTRRTFLQQASAFTLLSSATASSLAQQAMHDHMSMPMQAAKTNTASAPEPKRLRADTLTPFVDPLPIPQRITPDAKTLRISMREVHTKVHRDVPATRFWAYTDASSKNPTALSPVIEARSGQPLRIEWINDLPTKHFLPIDFSLHGCGRELPEVRTVTHLHGARVPTKDDGYPDDWFTHGHSRTCTYPLQQEATALWFHDHAMGLNRLNSYAGLSGMVLVRDEAEDALNLPSGEHEIPLILADRYLTVEGQLYYPTSGDPEHPWVPEFYADAVLINGVVKPFLQVEPRVYRLRLLNAANSRFFALALSDNLPLHLIGSDQGLLAERATVDNLLMAPAERADILVDFSQSAGKSVHLVNGVVPLMQFRVASSKPTSSKPTPETFPTALRPITAIPESSAIVTRTITLDEVQDKAQNPMMMLLNGKHWHEPVTERPRLNTTEIWEFVNLTEDTHPMHLHLVRFQVLDRRVFEPFDFTVYKRFKYLSPATPPEPHERGWKDIVQCHPGTVTRIIVRFEGYTGNYLYHCHVLEHEANDMMRPFEVIA